MNKKYQLDINPIHFLNILFISIVLYLHHKTYTNNYFILLSDYKINSILQKFAVGGFFFFSGYKLSMSNSKTPAKIFIMKRILRIYVLYIIALGIASVTYYPYGNGGEYLSLKNLLIHTLCLQMIFSNVLGPTVLTVWFVSALFCYYLYFLIFRNYINNTKKMIIISSISYLIITIIYLSTLNKNIHIFTRDFPVYLMFFSSGMIFSANYKYRFNALWALIIYFLSSLILMFIYKYIYINTLYEHLIFSFFVLTGNIILYISIYHKISKLNNIVTGSFIIEKYSYASFCIFLFHRSIWSIMATIYPKGTFSQWIFIVLIGAPATIIICFFIQKTYDSLTKHAQQMVSRRLTQGSIPRFLKSKRS